jgi:O-antigen ligase
MITRKKILLSIRKIKYDTSPVFSVFVAFIGIVFLLGGSSRPDIFSLIILRPLAVIAIFFGLYFIQREHIKQYLFFFGFSSAVLLIIVLQVIPLPPSVWTALPGRELISEIDREAGIAGNWRPFAMAPSFAWNALFSLSVPICCLVFGAQLNGQQIERLASVLLIACGVSAIIAFLQILGSPESPFYLYRITNRGAAVGLFANRNHQAIFLSSMLPLVAVYAARRGRSRREDRRRLFMCLAGGLFIVPLILVTGSRAGLFAGAVGVLIAAPLYRVASVRVRNKRIVSRQLLIGTSISLLSVAALIIWAVSAGRAEAIKRLLAAPQVDDVRYEYWTVTLSQIEKFMPFGSGAGSYERVFQAVEPSTILSSSYSNHAHNDWLELFMTMGLPGILLLLVAIVAFVVATKRMINQPSKGRAVGLGWAGLSIIFMIAAGSLVDYPLRVPTIASLFVIACLWVQHGITASRATIQR